MKRQAKKSILVSNWHWLFLSSNPSVHDLVHVPVVCVQTCPPSYVSLMMCSKAEPPVGLIASHGCCFLANDSNFASITENVDVEMHVIHDGTKCFYQVCALTLKRVKTSVTYLSCLPSWPFHFSHEMPTQCHSHFMHGGWEKQLHEDKTYLTCHVQKANESLYFYLYSFKTLPTIRPHPTCCNSYCYYTYYNHFQQHA